MSTTVTTLAALVVAAAAVPAAPAAGATATAAGATAATATAAPAAVRAAGATKLTFASYNICRPSACRSPAGYGTRFAAAVRTIAAARADVLAVQEVDDYDGTYARLVRALAPLGYAPAVRPLAQPNYPRTRTPIGCTPYCGNHLFFRSATVDLVRTGAGAAFSGYLPLARITPAGTWRTVKDRPIAYALLRSRAGGARVLATSIHLPQQSMRSSAAFQQASDVARNRGALGIAQWSAAYARLLGIPGVATFVMGDFNSYNRKHPDGPQAQIQRRGWRNAEQARRRVNARFATVNLGGGGFPNRPERYPNGGPRIDAVMTRNVAVIARHEVVLHRLPGGRFDPRYAGSDHNLVRVVVRV